MAVAEKRARRTIDPNSSRKKQKDQKKQSLLQANMDSIAKRGLTETTVTHISKTAGMSRGIINFYWGSKEEMMQETLQHLLDVETETWQDAMKKSDGKRNAQQLEAIAGAFFSSKVSSKKHLACWAAFIAHAASHNAYRSLFEQANLKLREALSNLLNDPENDYADDNALRLIAYIRGARFELILNDTERTREDLSEDAGVFAYNLYEESVADLKPKPMLAAHNPHANHNVTRSDEERPLLAIRDLFDAA